MERTLRAGREELKVALENIGKMICYYDIPTRTLILPQSYAEKHADPREIKGIPYASKNVVSEDRPIYYAFYEMLIKGETPEPIVVRVRNARGGYAWERLSATLLRDEKGLPLRAVITIDDMTQEMNHEAENELNRMLMSWADTCVCDYDVALDTLHLQTSGRGKGIETKVVKGYYDHILNTEVIQADCREELRAVIASASETPSRGSLDYVADIWGTGFRWCRLNYVSLADQAGRVYRMVGQVVDVEDEKKREILMRRLGEEDDAALMPKLDVPIAERVFQLLYKSTDLEKSVAEALKITGSYYRASRAALFLDAPSHKSCANTCEWVAEGVPSRMSERQNVPVAFDDGSDVYEKLYDKNGVLVCSDSGVYTEAQRRVLMMDDVASAVRSKLMDGSTCCGFVSFESCGQKRLWTEEEAETITLIARLIGVFLTARLRMDDALFSQEATSVLENCSSYIYIIDPADYKVLFANKKIREACPEAGLEGVPCYSLFMGEEAPCTKCPVALYKKTGKSTGVETTRPNGTCLLACASSFLWRGREIMMIECTDITRQKRAEAALRQQNEENSIVIRHSGAERLRYNLTERIAYHSARGAAQFGVPQVMSNFPQSFIDAGKVAEESVGAFLAYFESMRNGVPNGSANVLVRVASGESRWYHSDYTLMASGNGAPASAIVSFYDNTEMMEREVAYRKWQALLASKLEHSAVYLEVNLSQNYVERSENTPLPFKKGQSFNAYMRRCANATATEDREMYTEFFDEGRLLGLFLAGVKEDNLVFRQETKGLFRWTKANVQMVKYPYTDDVKAFIVFEDIHEERSAIVELAERASHDATTNLLNREAAMRAADERIEAMGASDRCAAFMIDLDNFKQINDSLGHLQGDEALIAASNKMRTILKGGEIIGRMGGDEFFIFLSGNVTPRSAAKTAKRLISALEVSCGFLHLTASVGVTVARKTDHITCRELYAAADSALYEAKRAGKNKYYLTEWPVQ